MTFTFETLPIENKEILRQGILELFKRDIATVSCSFGTRNYVFIFGEGSFPAILRVNVESPHYTTDDILSELMWMDDLKNDVREICQPIPSLQNRLVERVTVGETAYLVTMFRKANGAVFPAKQWDAKFFYSAGAMLGKIHRTSYEEHQRGFRYKRKHWDESYYYDFSCYDEYFEPSMRKNAETVFQKIKEIPRDPRWYGMIHGDYHNGNMFYDWGELWLYDFSECSYGYFMFDIASFMHFCAHSREYAAIHPNTSAHERMCEEGGFLTHFRAGYSSEYQLPEEQWALVHDFFRLRVAQVATIHLVYKMFPRDILIALEEPMLAYLKYDKLPIDRLEEVQKETLLRLTPEQVTFITNGAMG